MNLAGVLGLYPCAMVGVLHISLLPGDGVLQWRTSGLSCGQFAGGHFAVGDRLSGSNLRTGVMHLARIFPCCPNKSFRTTFRRWPFVRNPPRVQRVVCESRPRAERVQDIAPYCSPTTRCACGNTTSHLELQRSPHSLHGTRRNVAGHV